MRYGRCPLTGCHVIAAERPLASAVPVNHAAREADLVERGKGEKREGGREMSEGRRERDRVKGKEGRSGIERGPAMHVRAKGRKRTNNNDDGIANGSTGNVNDKAAAAVGGE